MPGDNWKGDEKWNGQSLRLWFFLLAAYGCADIGNKAYQDRIAKNLAVVEKHFHSEGLSDVEKALEIFTDDVVWDAPAPNGLNRSFAGKEAAGNNYRRLWGAMHNVKFQPVQRFATEAGSWTTPSSRSRYQKTGILFIGAYVV